MATAHDFDRNRGSNIPGATFNGSLAALLACILVALAAPQARAGNESAVSPQSAVYSGLVPSDAFFAIYCYPRRVLATPSLAKLGVDQLFADTVEHGGFSPLELDQMTMLVGPGIAANPQQRHHEPRMAFIGRFSMPHDAAKMAAKWLGGQKVEEFEVAGHKCFRAVRQPNRFGPRDEPDYCFLDSRTFLAVSESWMADVLAAKGATSPLISALAASNHGADATIVFASSDAAKQMIAEEFVPNMIGGPAKSIADLTSLCQTARLSVFTDPEISLKLTIIGNDAASAGQIAKTIQSLQQLGQAILPTLKTPPGKDTPAEERESRDYAAGLAKKLIDGLVPHQTGTQVVVDIGSLGTVDSIVGKLLLPMVISQRESALRFEGMNNLKQLALATLSSDVSSAHFPTHAIRSKTGKPLLSWRVYLLPQLDQAALFKQFHLDEPWDSPHNKPLIAKMPAVFKKPGSKTIAAGQTCYVVPVGKNTIFDGDKGVTMSQITDGASNTILILEVGEDKAVTWTKPDDLNFDPQKPLSGLGKIAPSGLQAAFADASVRTIRKNIDAETFRRLILRNDGKPIDQSKL